MKTSKSLQHTVAFLACALTMAIPELAAATGPNPIADVLCDVVDWMTGPVGAGIATLAVIIIGVGALLGKVSWGMAIIVGLGVAIVFGAPAVIDSLSSVNNTQC